MTKSIEAGRNYREVIDEDETYTGTKYVKPGGIEPRRDGTDKLVFKIIGEDNIFLIWDKNMFFLKVYKPNRDKLPKIVRPKFYGWSKPESKDSEPEYIKTEYYNENFTELRFYIDGKVICIHRSDMWFLNPY